MGARLLSFFLVASFLAATTHSAPSRVPVPEPPTTETSTEKMSLNDLRVQLNRKMRER